MILYVINAQSAECVYDYYARTVAQRGCRITIVEGRRHVDDMFLEADEAWLLTLPNEETVQVRSAARVARCFERQWKTHKWVLNMNIVWATGLILVIQTTRGGARGGVVVSKKQKTCSGWWWFREKACLGW